MSLEKYSSPEREQLMAEQFILNAVDQDLVQLEKDVERLQDLKKKGAVYDPLDEDVEIFDYKNKNISEEQRETIAQTFSRKTDSLEKLSDIRNFWHYFMREIIRRNLETDLSEDLKERLKDFLYENPARAIWMLQEMRGIAAALGQLQKKEAYKTLTLLRKAINVLKDEELPSAEEFQEELITTEDTLLEVRKQLEGVVQ